MEKFKRTFSVRKKKDAVPESSKPHQWQEDERKVREGTCSFQVKVRHFWVKVNVYNLGQGQLAALELFVYFGRNVTSTHETW